jgi:hypothetical protein
MRRLLLPLLLLACSAPVHAANVNLSATLTNSCVLSVGSVVIGGGGQRKVLAIADHLEPGETHQFRVCAEAPPQPAEIVHARVCSTLSARRIARR